MTLPILFDAKFLICHINDTIWKFIAVNLHIFNLLLWMTYVTHQLNEMHRIHFNRNENFEFGAKKNNTDETMQLIPSTSCILAITRKIR